MLVLKEHMIASAHKALDLTVGSDGVSWNSRLDEYMVDVSESGSCAF